MAEQLQETRAERAARNQSLFREVNERLEEVMSELKMFHEFVCECADTQCAETLSLTHDEYQSIRNGPIRFAVAPGHGLPEVESVVETTDRYAVVEKYGSAADAAARYHRRRDE